MPRCPSCRERLSGDLDRHGARCPYCREPLYEADPHGPRRRREVGQCAVHPDNPAASTCQRCGNYVCEVCRTRWRERWLCAACVDRALDRKEAVPAEAAAHLRQALLALVLGAVSWGIILVGVLVATAAVSSKNIGLVVVASLVLLVSPVASILGLGQAVAALRTRGDHMILATIGLILSGLHVGSIVGLLTFSLSQN
jgi:hypothetical protein